MSMIITACSLFCAVLWPAVSPMNLGVVRGRVTEIDGPPVSNARITLEPGGHVAVTDRRGYFALGPVPDGRYSLRLTHLGYDDTVVEVTLDESSDAFVNIRLKPDPLKLQPLVVEIEAGSAPPGLESAGFYERLEQGHGRFFDPAYMAKWTGGETRLGVFLEHHAPIRLRRPRRDGFCQAAVYLNGRLNRMPGLGLYSVQEIAAIEFYEGTHGVPTWALGPSSTCGAVMIWRKHGL